MTMIFKFTIAKLDNQESPACEPISMAIRCGEHFPSDLQDLLNQLKEITEASWLHKESLEDSLGRFTDK